MHWGLSYVDTGSLAIAEMLVHLDTREGLVESYRLHLGDIMWWQILDYKFTTKYFIIPTHLTLLESKDYRSL